MKGPPGNRLLTSFQNKCIQGTVGTDSSSCPKISCSSGQSFSISTLQIATDVDIDLDFIYGMADGSTCKQSASCSSSGSMVTNSQCGGATSVTFQVPSGGQQSSCQVGIQSVGFDCAPPSSTVPPQSQSTPSSSVSQSQSESQSQSSPQSTPTSQGGSQSTSQSESQSQASAQTTSTSEVSAQSSSSAPVSSPIQFTTSTVFDTITQTITTCAATITDCPAHPSSQTEVITVTSTTAVSVTICPVTANETP